MLAVAGKLDRDARRAVDRPRRPATTAAARSTRTISRHDLNALLRLFDFPDPNITSERAHGDDGAAAAAVRAQQRVHGRAGEGARGAAGEASSRTTTRRASGGRIALALRPRRRREPRCSWAWRFSAAEPTTGEAERQADAAGSSTPRCCWAATSSCSSIELTPLESDMRAPCIDHASRRSTRREMLRRIGGGFGALGLAGVLADAGPARAPAADAAEPARAEAAALPRRRRSASSTCS